MKTRSLVCLLLSIVHFIACIMYDNIGDKINAGVISFWFLSAAKYKIP